MTYTAFDPRVDIINAIGYSYDVDDDGVDESCISFSYPDGPLKGDTCYVPLFMPSEARTGELPYFPFIELTLVDAPGRVDNVQGDTRFDKAYVDFNIYVANKDEITIKTWVKDLKDELIDRIMTYRHTVSDCTWVEPEDTGREIIETDGKRVVFHYVVSAYANRYQGP